MAWIDGKQVVLASGPNDEAENGPTFRAAQAEFKRRKWGAIFGPTVAEISAAYLTWYQSTHPVSSMTAIADRLRPLTEAMGERHVAQLSGPDVENWCAEQRSARGWSDSTVRLTLRAVSAAVRHAVRAKLLPTDPLGRLTLPPETSRGIEVVLSPSQEAAVFIHANNATRDLCIVLRDTGCRPGEASAAEARHYDRHLRALVFPATARSGPTHKTGGKTGRPRIVYLQGEAAELVEHLCERWPSGPILRTRDERRTGPHAGKRWGWTGNGMTQVFKRLRTRANVPGLVPYSFRHTFAVRRLREGWDVHALAEVMGTSVLMLQRHYLHLAQQTDFYRRLVDGIDRGGMK